jgi:hypothetical protein
VEGVDVNGGGPLPWSARDTAQLGTTPAEQDVGRENTGT